MNKNIQYGRICHTVPESWILSEDETARYFCVPEDQLLSQVQRFRSEGQVLVSIFAVEEFGDFKGCSLFYLFEIRDSSRFTVLVTGVKAPVSVAEIYPVASLFEREIGDGFGISFLGAFDTRRLWLHECYPEDFHPLRRSFQNGLVPPGNMPDPYQFREIQGTAVFQVPVGPVHAGIIEPGHFRFSVIGEEIVNLEIRLGYLHRGVEKMAEGKSPQDVVPIAEAVSGDESVAHACSFCLAVEQAAGIPVPKRAENIRGILLELERACCLLADLAGMVTDIGHPVSAARFLVLREEIQRLAAELTGSRFMKGSIQIGGVARDIPPVALQVLFTSSGKAEHDLRELAGWVLSIPSVLDRFATTGVINADLVEPLALSGPLVRASGYQADVRIDHPYGIYRQSPSSQVCEQEGDVLARFTLKYREILSSFRQIQELILFIPDGPVTAPGSGMDPVPDGYSLSAVESPRGMLITWMYCKNGLIQRLKIRNPSFCNWYALEHAVLGNILPDFPLINKSLNLSYAGTDL
jgi:Ni,Fe-hydrogenase III large subunit/Ni,Fe-hydrogenase III component G